MKRSRLSDIPGVGPKRVKDLLGHFHSIDAIQLAPVETLALAPGVGLALARDIHRFFHPDEDGNQEGEQDGQIQDPDSSTP